MRTQSKIWMSIVASVAVSAVICFVVFSILKDMQNDVLRSTKYNDIIQKAFALSSLAATFKEEANLRQVQQAEEVHTSLGKLLDNISSSDALEDALLNHLRRNNLELGPVLDQFFGKREGFARSTETERRGLLASQLLIKVRFITDDTNSLMDISQSRIISAQHKTGISVLVLIGILILTNAAIYFFSHRSIVRTEEARRESEAKLRMALNASRMGVWHLDITQKERWFDNQVCTLLGINPTKFTGTAEEFFNTIHPDDCDTIKAALARTIEHGVPYETEYRTVWPDGSIHYISARGKLVHDDKGKPVRLDGLIWDITDSRQAEETLRTTVQRFHNILSNIFVGILVVTEDDRIEFVNQNFCDQFDIAEAPSDLIGLTTAEMLQKVLTAYADPEANLARIRQILSQRHRMEDEEVPMRNGRVYLRDYVPILVDGEPCGRMWQHRDITERKRAEEELRKSRDELELRVRERTAELVAASENLRQQAELLDLAHDAIFVRGLDHTVKFWNDGAVELYGFNREEALGKVTQDLLHSEFSEPIDKIVHQVLESGRWEGELRQTTSTGKKMLVESRWALQHGREGEPLGFLEINRDVTPRKLAEEALRANMARLELLNEELQEFAFIASHDLQEPLRKIQTFGNILVRKHSESLDLEGQDYMGRVIRAATRMSELLRALLNYSRTGTSELDYQAVSLTEVAREAASDLELRINNANGRVEIGELPTVHADAPLMRQLFQNIIGNAIKYRKESEPPIVKIYSEISSAACRIMVEDNGIGFDECYCHKIFKPFERLHGMNSPYRGTGMGLAICKKIVDRHGGQITVRSIPGVGTTFVVTLPMEQKAGA